MRMRFGGLGRLQQASWWVAAFSALFLGCSTGNDSNRGPINIDYLWKAWETSGYHPDRESRFKSTIGGPRSGGVVVEKFFNDEVHIPFDSGNSTTGHNIYVRQYFCKEISSDTCFFFSLFDQILGPDSTLNYRVVSGINDYRKIRVLTDSELELKEGAESYTMKPSERTLVDTSGGIMKVE